MTRMVETLVGERVVLRRPRVTDAVAIWTSCKHKDISRWIPTMPSPYRKKDAVWFINDCAQKWKKHESYQYAIEYEGTLAGMVGLALKKEGVAELGYWLAPSYRGKGLATEAARLLISEGFSKFKLHKIYARHMDGNEASGNIMRKLRMVHEGTLRKQVFRFGKYYDELCYGILRSEFK